MNNLCKHCNVHIKSDLMNCPLCGRYIAANDGMRLPSTYADTEIECKNRSFEGITVAIKILMLTAFLSIVLNGFINAIQQRYFDHTKLWGVYAAILLVNVVICILLPIKRRRYKTKEMAYSLLCVIASLILIDLCIDVRIDFSILYVIPSLLSLDTVLLLIFGLMKRHADNANIFFTMFLSMAAAIAYLVLDVTLLLTETIQGAILVPIILFLLQFCLFLVLFFFRYRPYVKNLIKKFHSSQ